MPSRIALSVLLVGTLLRLIGMDASRVEANEWTRFRGPNGTGESESPGIPTNWTAADYRWIANLPGQGHSSPVIWEQRLFVQSADPEAGTHHVICLDTESGQPRWQRDFSNSTYPIHTRNSLATATPTVDAEMVYVAWANPDRLTLAALNHDGELIWQRDDLGAFPCEHGFGISPILANDLVILSNQHDSESGSPRVMAFHRRTGELQWQTPRKVGKTSYSVPCLHTNAEGKTSLIGCSTEDGIYSLDVATGKESWSTSVFTMRTVSSPIVVGKLVFGSNGSGAGGNFVTAVRIDGNHEVAYQVKQQAPYVPSMVAAKDLLFLWSDQGVVSCLQADTGDVYWTKRIGGNFSSSPIRIAQGIYNISDTGEITVLSATKSFRELGKIELDEGSRSTPAVSGGQLYWRTTSKIFCLGQKR